ncbi:hypothetical protein [Acinetobacter bereziniae]|nr:hypothetical protein [Acinetobacter bereziniae]
MLVASVPAVGALFTVILVNVGVALVATEYDIEPSAAVVGVTTIFDPATTLR